MKYILYFTAIKSTFTLSLWHCAGLGLDSLFLRGKQRSAVMPADRGLSGQPHKNSLKFEHQKITGEYSPGENSLHFWTSKDNKNSGYTNVDISR